MSQAAVVIPLGKRVNMYKADYIFLSMVCRPWTVFKAGFYAAKTNQPKQTNTQNHPLELAAIIETWADESQCYDVNNN